MNRFIPQGRTSCGLYSRSAQLFKICLPKSHAVVVISTSALPFISLRFLLIFGNRTAEVPLTTYSPLTDQRDHEGELFLQVGVSLCYIRVYNDLEPARLARLTRTAGHTARRLGRL